MVKTPAMMFASASTKLFGVWVKDISVEQLDGVMD